MLQKIYNRAMRKATFLNMSLFFLLLFLLTSPVLARSGCCSRHGGVCGCGCCDGTSLSSTCAPYYPECGGGGAVQQTQPEYIPPTSSPVYIPPTSTPYIPHPTKTPYPTSTPKPTKIPTSKKKIKKITTPRIIRHPTIISNQIIDSTTEQRNNILRWFIGLFK